MESRFVRELGKELEGHRLEIWDGRSAHRTPAECETYRARWLADAETEIIAGTQGRSLLCESRLRNLVRCVRATMPLNHPMLEVGVFRGGSAWVIGVADRARQLLCVDTFDGHPEDETAVGGHARGDFATDPADTTAFLRPCKNVKVVAGRWPDVSGLPALYSFIHLDCDYLTADLVNRAWRQLAPGGILVVDDYGQDDCPTVREAIDAVYKPDYVEERQAVLMKPERHSPVGRIRRDRSVAVTEVLIEQRLGPGDMLGGVVPLVESIHRQFPGQFLTDVAGTCAEAIFANSPHITRLRNPRHRVYAHYNVGGSDARSFSFAQAHCDHFSQAMHLPTPLVNQTRKPALYLTGEERKPLPGMPQWYAVMTSGYKRDCTIKGQGSHLFWRDVVDYCRAHGVAVLQVGERNPDHVHDPIPGAVNMIGATTTRQLIRLVAGAVCTFSSISFLTHISAAFDIPNLCLSSRESNDFAMYRTTISLNCIGLLPCASGNAAGGCWKNHLERLGSDGKPTGDSCSLPVIQEDGTKVPTCTDIVRKSGVAIGHLKKIFLARGATHD